MAPQARIWHVSSISLNSGGATLVLQFQNEGMQERGRALITSRMSQSLRFVILNYI
jgi:hypothetical protein